MMKACEEISGFETRQRPERSDLIRDPDCRPKEPFLRARTILEPQPRAQGAGQDPGEAADELHREARRRTATRDARPPSESRSGPIRDRDGSPNVRVRPLIAPSSPIDVSGRRVHFQQTMDPARNSLILAECAVEAVHHGAQHVAGCGELAGLDQHLNRHASHHLDPRQRRQ
jgi:hypothetical protein